ncbi:protease SohB [Fontimonas thermophila]|uniref:protease SohB n=1 Tax=Fontimonas thermophila TaxID=1076937 RepID=UPI000B89E2E1|nr:protease SohB [Fontimonas thermophila]
MSAFLTEYGLFLAKTLTVLAAVLVVLAAAMTAIREQSVHRRGDRLEVHDLNERFRGLADSVRDTLLSDAARKALHKQRRKQAKARRKGDTPTRRPRLFVLNFRGDLHAHAVDELREEISAVLQVAESGDEVLLRLESEGGLVHAYGLGASQLARFKQRGIPLTVAVDKVAASGGYLMACVADRIIAAPFAVIGSIGVVGQLPNFNRLLRRMDIDYELHTAGEFKRTLTLFGENTEAARAKFREELEETHALFKQFVAEHRPQLDLARVATGEHWFGARALALKLVDALQTSDDYLLQKIDEADLVELRFRRHRTLSDRLARGLIRLGGGLLRGAQDMAGTRWR